MQIRGEQKDTETAPRDCRSSDAQLRRITEGGREGIGTLVAWWWRGVSGRWKMGKGDWRNETEDE